MKFTESQLEQAFIDLLGQEDIPHVLGGDIERSSREVLIKDDQFRIDTLVHLSPYREPSMPYL